MFVCLQIIESEDDRSKSEQLFDRYAGLMYCIASKYLSNEQDREDAVQTVFEAIIRNISKLSVIDSPQTYSYIVNTIESKSIDVLRRLHKIEKQTIEMNSNYPGVQAEVEIDDELATALTRLPSHYREILLLRYDCGYTTKELSSMLGITRSNVQKQIWRAKEPLSKLLGER